MAKKKKSPTQEFRNVAQVAMGAGMVGSMTPLISNPSQANFSNAFQGTMNMAILSPMAAMGFNAIDNISAQNSTKKKQ